jgi:hypothetical protein
MGAAFVGVGAHGAIFVDAVTSSEESDDFIATPVEQSAFG